MKLYTFAHSMVSPMAKGIQAQHSVARLFGKYKESTTSQYKMLHEWEENHSTIIALNGGVTPELDELVAFMEESPYPWSYFREDESLGKLITSVCCVIPERIYDIAIEIKKKNVRWVEYSSQFTHVDGHIYGDNWTDWEVELVHKLSVARMAN